MPGDEISRNREEHIDADIPAGDLRRPEMKKHHDHHGERSQRLYLGPESLHG
jgi:hypothetical protein